MWCDKCKYSTTSPPKEITVKITESLAREITDPTVIVITKTDIEQWKSEGKNPDEEIRKLKEERKKLIQYMFNQLKSLYPAVIWCTKKKTFVCCNPKKPTTYVDMSKECEYFELKV